MVNQATAKEMLCRQGEPLPFNFGFSCRGGPSVLTQLDIRSNPKAIGRPFPAERTLCCRCSALLLLPNNSTQRDMECRRMPSLARFPNLPLSVPHHCLMLGYRPECKGLGEISRSQGLAKSSPKRRENCASHSRVTTGEKRSLPSGCVSKWHFWGSALTYMTKCLFALQGQLLISHPPFSLHLAWRGICAAATSAEKHACSSTGYSYLSRSRYGVSAYSSYDLFC